MYKLFGRGENSLQELPFNLDASRLREDERLELIYNANGKLITIKKVKLNLFHNGLEARANTDILPGGTGWIAFEGSQWKARTEGNTRIKAGTKVLVVARHYSTLLVLPA